MKLHFGISCIGPLKKAGKERNYLSPWKKPIADSDLPNTWTPSRPKEDFPPGGCQRYYVYIKVNEFNFDYFCFQNCQ